MEIHTPNKIKNFLWLLQHNKLPTNLHLSKLRLNIPPNCQICQTHTKDINHIFSSCTLTLGFWADLFKRSTKNPNMNISSFTNNNWLTSWRKLQNKASTTFSSGLSYCLSVSGLPGRIGTKIFLIILIIKLPFNRPTPKLLNTFTSNTPTLQLGTSNTFTSNGSPHKEATTNLM